MIEYGRKIKKNWMTKSGHQALIFYVNNSHHCGYIGVDTTSCFYRQDYSDTILIGGENSTLSCLFTVHGV